jgi:membrane protein
MAEKTSSVFDILKKTGKDFMADSCPREAAALAYYTVFSLPPLLVLIMTIAGAVWDPQDVQAALRGQLGSLVGQSGSEQIETIMQEAERPEGSATLATLLGVGALLFGATGAFMQLQGALNRAWDVQPDPAQGGIRNFLLKRAMSLGMILAIAFLVLVSLALSAALSAFGDALGARLPGISGPLLLGLNFVISLTVITTLFASMFKVLPDAEVSWHDVWVGAIATSVLFVIGKFAIGFYLGRSEPGSAFGAAGSLAVILLWVYYAGMILLFGAEFTQSWAEARGKGIQPENGAARVKEKKEIQRGPREQRKAAVESAKEGEPAPPPKETIEK